MQAAAEGAAETQRVRGQSRRRLNITNSTRRSMCGRLPSSLRMKRGCRHAVRCSPSLAGRMAMRGCRVIPGAFRTIASRHCSCSTRSSVGRRATSNSERPLVRHIRDESLSGAGRS